MQKRLKQISTMLLAVILLVVAVGCSEQTPSGMVADVTSPFMPSADDQSQEAQLRREFYAQHGSFLLFNDTLQHYATGLDVNGTQHYFTETLDLMYEIGMSTQSNTTYTYTLIPTMELRTEAVDYLENYILTHISGQLMPYSWLLVDKITRDNLGNTSSPYAATGQRAVVIATNLLPKLSDSQKEQYTRQVMNVIIAKLATDNAAAFDEFYAVSQSYYDDSFTAPSTTAENTRLLAEAGFVCRGQSYGTDQNGLYPSRELDLNAFSRLVVGNTDESLQTKYAEYPLVLQKLQIMRSVLTELGYVE